jgi:hypothetical protein
MEESNFLDTNLINERDTVYRWAAVSLKLLGALLSVLLMVSVYELWHLIVLRRAHQTIGQSLPVSDLTIQEELLRKQVSFLQTWHAPCPVMTMVMRIAEYLPNDVCFRQVSCNETNEQKTICIEGSALHVDSVMQLLREAQQGNVACNIRLTSLHQDGDGQAHFSLQVMLGT